MFNAVPNNLPLALLGLVLAFAAAACLVPLGIKIAWRLDIIDRPRGNRLHARATPLMGGVSIAVGGRVQGQYHLEDPAAVREWLKGIAGLIDSHHE